MTFSYLVTAFFTTYLAAERGLAANTIASYSDCMKLLFKFACERFGVQLEKLDVSHLSRELVIDFLDYLESTRNNLVSTRNQRLAAIKTLFRFLAGNVPQLMHLNETIQAIKEKEVDKQPPPSLTMSEVNAILAQPDRSTVLGARDDAMLQLFYNTGARAQEVADLDIDVRREDEPGVILSQSRKARKGWTGTGRPGKRRWSTRPWPLTRLVGKRSTIMLRPWRVAGRSSPCRPRRPVSLRSAGVLSEAGERKSGFEPVDGDDGIPIQTLTQGYVAKNRVKTAFLAL